ncbi:MAG: hypothetical protein K8R36_25700 [Planctomycetales bacterium]|nr:hypothetical protein [Planctomycetales bacterium]
MKFSLRDLVLVTAVIALAMGWMVDRAKLAWQYEYVVGANERLQELLDKADPNWETKRRQDAARTLTKFDRNPSPTAAFATGMLLFGVAILLIVLAWQRRLDTDLLNRRCR